MTRKPALRTKLVFATTLIGLSAGSCCLRATAQGRANWRAASSNAKSITGDVFFSEDRVSINFLTFAIANIRRLEGPEMGALFDADSNASLTGNLYRLNVPGATKFLRRNTLCGNDDVTWMATFVSGHSLQLAFFSGEKPPTLTMDALATSTERCGTFAYVN
jgi:hypothetical protein